MSVTITGDLSERVDWVVREKTDTTLTINCTVASVAHDLTPYVFIADFFVVGSSTPFLSLTEGAGIANNGASGVLSIALTDTQLTIKANQYFWKLRTTAPTDNLWFNGSFIVKDYLWEGASSSSVSVALTIGATTIDLALSLVSNTGTVSDAVFGAGWNGVTDIAPSKNSVYDKVVLLAVADTTLQTNIDAKAPLVTRVVSAADTATLTPDIDSYDMAVLTAQAQALTIAAPTGTASNGNAFVFRIKDNGTARAITFNGIYRAIGSALPTTTTISKTLYFVAVYESTAVKWDVFPSNLEV